MVLRGEGYETKIGLQQPAARGFACSPKFNALASTTWYVDGVHGNDQNNCKSQQTACKTIGHAILLASSGDSIMVTPATYTENLTIGISLKVIGAGAGTIIIDGGHDGTVVTVNASAAVTLLNVTIRHGIANEGGGIYNLGTLTLGNCTVSENSATSHETALGGGIANGGTLTVTNSILFGLRREREMDSTKVTVYSDQF